MSYPLNTYRIQFNKDFTFQHLKEIIPYLSELGIDCIYASPIFKAVPGSNHGYDITDPHHINPEIGGYSELIKLKEELNKNNIKWIQDIVPNHMAYHPENYWLMDVLEKKKESEYYNFFDINWQHPMYKNKLMAPVLGESLDEAISTGKIKLKLTEEGVNICYYDHIFPAAINSYKYILDAANYLKRKVLSIINRDDEIQENLDRFSKNSMLLKEFLDLQNFQLVHWQETDKIINYRRFFTINGLICLKMEEENVFHHYHKFIFRLIKEEIFDGLRIDHIDGLLDPANYLTRLRKIIGKDKFIVVEKILEPKESVPGNWKIQGTTGYDFLAHVNRLMTDNSNHEKLKNVYQKFTGFDDDYTNVVFENKLNFLRDHMHGELANLYMLLKQLIPDAGKDALASLLAAMPVYRLYPSQKGLSDFDIKILEKAAIIAKKYESEKEVDKILEMLSKGSGEEWLYFMQRFQQLSGPLAAKGIEDTTFYQYNLLISHNEVGNSLEINNYTTNNFTDFLVERNKNFKNTINATSTHDTKRGEDARMRINVLSEQPDKWEEHVLKFKDLNKNLKNNSIPDDNDEYFLYQAIIGSLPLNESSDENYTKRLKNYMIKVVREGKINSGWNQPNESYEKGLKSFIDNIFQNLNFTEELRNYVKGIAFYGSLNSFSQLALKLTSPGIADIYQGSELWNFSFVDPDNRNKINYHLSKQLSEKIKNKSFETIFEDFQTAFNSHAIKLFLTNKLLQLRIEFPELFSNGEFTPIVVTGELKDNIFSFSRAIDNQEAIITCGRLFTSVYSDYKLEENAWKNTFIKVNNPGTFKDILLGEDKEITSEMPVDVIFDHLPVSVLIRK